MDTGESKTFQTGHSRWIKSVLFSPEMNLIITGGLDGLIELWKVGATLDSMEPVTTIEVGETIESLVLIDALLVAGTREGNLLTYVLQDDFSRMSVMKIPVGDGGISHVCARDDRPDVYLATFEGNLWRLNSTTRQLESVQKFGGKTITSLGWLPGRGVAVGLDKGPITIWQQRGNIHRLAAKFQVHKDSTESIVDAGPSYEKSMGFFSAGMDGRICYSDFISRQVISEIKIEKGYVKRLSFWEDRGILISGDNNKEIKVWTLDKDFRSP